MMNFSKPTHSLLQADLLFSAAILLILAALSIALEHNSLKPKTAVQTVAVPPIQVITASRRAIEYDRRVYDSNPQEIADEELKDKQTKKTE